MASYHLDTWGSFRFPDELDDSTGYIWDKETSLFFAKARFYDPALGRFISQDSFLGDVDEPPSLHRYLYAYSNPLRFIDPTGLNVWDYATYSPLFLKAISLRFPATRRGLPSQA